MSRPPSSTGYLTAVATMTEAAALPLVVFFGVVTVLLVRSREVNWWVAVLIFLFGLYVGQTPAVFMISEFVNWIFGRLTA